MPQSQITNALCPLCGASAFYTECDHGERHYFRCPSCTQFVITTNAEKRLRASAAPSDFARAARDAVAQGEGRLLDIRYEYVGNPPGFLMEVLKSTDLPSIRR